MADRVFLENAVDAESWSQLDPFTESTTLSDPDADLLDILLVTNNLRYTVFDSKLYRLLGKYLEDADYNQLTGYFVAALP